MLRTLLIAVVWLALSSASFAQFGFTCPPGSRPVSGGGGMMCQCPDGSFAGLYSGCPSYQQPQQQQQVGDYCANGRTCPVGFRCSSTPGRCVPNGKVDCGSYYCEPGNVCWRSGCASPSQIAAEEAEEAR